MAYLTLNGITIPVASRSASSNHAGIGDKARAFDGSSLWDRRASKRKWSFTTPPVDVTTARAIEGIIRGEGELFQFTSFKRSPYGSAATIDLYSTKGYGPTVNRGGGYVRFGQANVRSVPANTSYNRGIFMETVNSVEALYEEDGSLEVASGETNDFTANVRNGTEDGTTTGFTALSACPIASSTNFAVEGSRSLKLDPAGAGDGVSCTGSTFILGSSNITASFYILVDRFFPASFNLVLRGSASGVVASRTTASLGPGRWSRVEITATSVAASNTTVDLEVTTNVGGGFTWYMDCFQMERNRLRATPWVNGQRGVSESVEYSALPLMSTWDALTVNFWTKTYSASPTADQYLFTLQGVNGENRHFLYRNTSGALVAVTENGATQYTANGGNPWSGGAGPTDQQWHMITMVINPSADGTTLNRLELFVDGVSVATNNNAGITLDLANTATVFNVGSNGTANYYEGNFQDLSVLPYAMLPEQLLAMYNFANIIADDYSIGSKPGRLPTVRMGGEVLGSFDPVRLLAGVEVIGRVVDIGYVQTGSVAAWENNRQVISFELEEV